VADVDHNYHQIENAIAMAAPKDCDIIVFPELSTTGYTCGDLFTQQTLLQEAETGIAEFAPATRAYANIYIIA
jgi:NAD+ synthase (glutamine-hydrolysing)